MDDKPIILQNYEFGAKINSISGENVNLCYQCKKCASGCPVSYLMDYHPNQIIHATRLGLQELVLNSKTIWLCSSCETCTTRCPQEIDIRKVLDAIRSVAVSEKIKSKAFGIEAFYKTALNNIRLFGRIYELGLIGELKLRTLEFMKDFGLGIKMIKKGKLKFLPTFKGFFAVKRIFKRVKKDL